MNQPSMMTLPVVEPVPADVRVHLVQVLGPTFQGEGPSRGRQCILIRFAGCNLGCGFCDSRHTWDPERGFHEWRRQVSVHDLLAYLHEHPVGLWSISGGEPLLQQSSPAMTVLLTAAARQQVDVEFETNGTLAPTAGVFGPAAAGQRARFNVSPKLANSGDPQHERIVPAALTAFVELSRRGRALFKFVVSDPADLDEVAELARTHDMPPERVWILPEGVSADVVLARAQALADPVLARGWNLTLRDHILLWGDDVRR